MARQTEGSLSAWWGVLFCAVVLLSSCNPNLFDGGAKTTPGEPPAAIRGKPELVSDNPLYTNIAKDPGGETAVSVLFDESQGTGEGYDLVYVDVGMKGDFENAIRAKAETRRERRLFQSGFPTIELSAEGTTPCVAFGFLSVRAHRVFDATVYLSMAGDNAKWDYSIFMPFDPVPNPDSAQVLIPDIKSELVIEAKADQGKPGNTGIALSLCERARIAQIFRDDQPVTATIVIKKLNGEVVEKDTDYWNKFRFG